MLGQFWGLDEVLVDEEVLGERSGDYFFLVCFSFCLFLRARAQGRGREREGGPEDPKRVPGPIAQSPLWGSNPMNGEIMT